MRDPAVPMIALTANAGDDSRAKYLNAGMDGFISKPIDEDALYDEIAKAIVRLRQQGRSLPSLPTLVNAPSGEPAAGNTAPQRIRIPGLSHEGVRRIAAAFLDDVPRRIELARKALRDKDAQLAATAFHAIKGAAGYLDAKQIKTLCSRLETLANEGALEQVEDGLVELDGALNAVYQDLRACYDLGADSYADLERN